MAFTIGLIIGKIMIAMYLVIGFLWFWKRVLKLCIKLIDIIIVKNHEVHKEKQQFWNDVFDDEHEEK